MKKGSLWNMLWESFVMGDLRVEVSVIIELGGKNRSTLEDRVLLVVIIGRDAMI